MKRVAILTISGLVLIALTWSVYLAFGVTRSGAALSPNDAVRDDNSDEATVPYPEEWETNLDDARGRVDFAVTVPDTPAANAQSIDHVFVWPNASQVAIDFPAPGESSVRQQYIEVAYSRWTSGEPLTHFQEDLKESPAVGKSIESVDGEPALVVEANSPTDDAGRNAAFLRMDVEGVDLQVSGGDDLGTLADIAKSILHQESVSS